MEGLAQSMAGPQAAAQPVQPVQPGQPAGLPSMEEILALLMQGIPPEKLEEMGVPPEMIVQAIDILEQQMAAEQGQQQAAAQQGGGGLAQQMVGNQL